MPADPTSPIAVFSKVALDQVLMAPCMTSVFFAAMAALEGSERSEVVQLVKRKLKPTLLANWTVWPIAHVINFALVPPAQRILYINVVNVSMGLVASSLVSCYRELVACEAQQDLEQLECGGASSAAAACTKSVCCLLVCRYNVLAGAGYSSLHCCSIVIADCLDCVHVSHG